jgi:hypothetical protein
MLFQAFQLQDTITIFNDKNTVEKHLFFLIRAYYFFIINSIHYVIELENSPPANRFQQVPTGSNGFQRVPTGSNRSQRVPTGSNRFQRVPTDSNGFQWVSTGPNGFQQILPGSNGSHTGVCFQFLDFFSIKNKKITVGKRFIFLIQSILLIINPCCFKLFSFRIR